MLNLIKEALLQIVSNIDTGNSNISEEESVKLIKYLNEFTNKEHKISKYQAYQYLNISRATFDNYVRLGKLPKGKKLVGFKELFWTKSDLDKCIEKLKQ